MNFKDVSIDFNTGSYLVISEGADMALTALSGAGSYEPTKVAKVAKEDSTKDVRAETKTRVREDSVELERKVSNENRSAQMSVQAGTPEQLLGGIDLSA